MTIVETAKFVARWRRILIPWPAHTDLEAARQMERSCLGISVGLLVCGVTVPIWSWPWVVVGPLFVIGLSTGWLGMRFRAARRVLEAAGVQSFVELRRE